MGPGPTHTRCVLSCLVVLWFPRPTSNLAKFVLRGKSAEKKKTVLIPGGGAPIASAIDSEEGENHKPKQNSVPPPFGPLTRPLPLPPLPDYSIETPQGWELS